MSAGMPALPAPLVMLLGAAGAPPLPAAAGLLFEPAAAVTAAVAARPAWLLMAAAPAWPLAAAEPAPLPLVAALGLAAVPAVLAAVVLPLVAARMGAAGAVPPDAGLAGIVELIRPAAPPELPATLGMDSMGATSFSQPMLDTKSASARQDQVVGVGMKAPSNAARRNSCVFVRLLCGTELGLWPNTQPRR